MFPKNSAWGEDQRARESREVDANIVVPEDEPRVGGLPPANPGLRAWPAQRIAESSVTIPVKVFEDWIETLSIQSDAPGGEVLADLAADMRSYFKG